MGIELNASYAERDRAIPCVYHMMAHIVVELKRGLSPITRHHRKCISTFPVLNPNRAVLPYACLPRTQRVWLLACGRVTESTLAVPSRNVLRCRRAG